MKHYIIVKWNDSVKDKNAIASEVKALFSGLLDLGGIHSVEVIKNVIDRANRYDFIIRIGMDKNALGLYDESSIHLDWKKRYSSLIESKAIFDEE